MDEPVISYSAKELLTRLESKVDVIAAKMDAYDTRLVTLEIERRTRRNWRAEVWAFLASSAAVIVAIIALTGVLH